MNLLVRRMMRRLRHALARQAEEYNRALLADLGLKH